MSDTTACLLRIEAVASACLLLRLMNIVARRDVTPLAVHAARVGDALHIDLHLEGVEDRVLGPLVGNVRQLVGVRALAVMGAPRARARAAA